jgi:isocitrate/isopropylmalate dehydrogenase
MLEWFNQPETLRGAVMIYSAVERVFASRVNRTADMGGRISTVEMGGLIVSSIR